MRFWLTICAISLLVSPAAADPLEDYADWAERYDTERQARHDEQMARCRPQTAMRLTFEEFALASAFYAGDCVSVSGLAWQTASFWQVYKTPEYVYLSERFRAERDPLIGGSDPFSFGIERNELSTPAEGPWLYEVTVTGIAKDCSAFGDYASRMSDITNMAAPPDGPIIIRMLSGYCHTYTTGVIDPTSINFGQRHQYPRRISDADRARLGSLNLLPVGSLRTELLGVAESFLRELRAGDREGLIRLNEGRTHRTALQSYFDDPQSPFASLRESSEQPQVEFFWPWSSQLAQREQDQFETYICFCRTADCAGRWPISMQDARLDPRRPYVCLIQARTFDESGSEKNDGLEPAFLYDTPSAFVEPDSPAPN